VLTIIANVCKAHNNNILLISPDIFGKEMKHLFTIWMLVETDLVPWFVAFTVSLLFGFEVGHNYSLNIFLENISVFRGFGRLGKGTSSSGSCILNFLFPFTYLHCFIV